MKSLILFAMAFLCLEVSYASKLKPQYPKIIQHYLWDSLNNNWLLSQTRSRIYNETNELLTETTFDEVGKSNLFKDSIVYEGESIKSRYKFIWNPNIKDYDNHYKIEYCTFVNDEECGQTSYSWDSELKEWQVMSGWENSYTFTNTNKKQFVVRNEFNPVSRTWDYKEKIEYEYFDDSKVKVQTNYTFDDESREFNPVYRVNYFEYSDSIPKEYNYEYNQFGSWIELLKFKYRKVGNLHIVTNYHLFPIESPNLKARMYVYTDNSDDFSQMDSVEGENGWRLIKDFKTTDTLNLLVENTFNNEGQLTLRTTEKTRFNEYGLITEKLNYIQNTGSDEYLEFGNKYNHVISDDGHLLQTITQQYNLVLKSFENVDKLVYLDFEAPTSITEELNVNKVSFDRTNNILRINEVLNDIAEVDVFDLTGRKILSKVSSQNEIILNINNFGIYFIVVNIDGVKHSIKVLK